jgi:ABC-2 type transport system permease protein
VLVFVAATSGGAVRGLSAEDLATFAFISQGLIMVVGVFGDTELSERIKTGDVVVDLYRPADLQLWWLATWLGKSSFHVLSRGIPPMLLGAIAFDLNWPEVWWHWLVFALSIVLACLVGFAVRFCSAIVTFWLLDSRGVDQAVTFTIGFFAGMLLPISLFPAQVETVARMLPFASMVQLPAELFLGIHSPSAIAWTLGQQALWAVALLAAGRAMVATATRKVVIQGG